MPAKMRLKMISFSYRPHAHLLMSLIHLSTAGDTLKTLYAITPRNILRKHREDYYLMKKAQAVQHTSAGDATFPRFLILITVLGLSLFGLVMIFSASSISAITEDVNQATYVFDQLRPAVIGVVLGLITWKLIPYQVWTTRFVWVVWAICMVLLILTAAMGLSALGAQRWLMIGPISLQPSEFVKIGIMLMAAHLFTKYRSGSSDFKEFIVSIIIGVLIPVVFLYFTQSDLGTTVIIAVGILSLLWLGGIPLRTILIIVITLFVLGILSIVLSSYRGGRFLFLDPWNDGMGGMGQGYQLVHSYYAIAEGGLTGVGLGNSHEKYLYLPESETDFIFSIICEELGLMGALVVIVGFLVLLYAGLSVARQASDEAGMMIAGSITVMLVFQAFLNIGCVIGVLPTTGKPLPFISSGGSSIMASFIMVGLILAVADGDTQKKRDKSARKRRNKFHIVHVEK